MPTHPVRARMWLKIVSENPLPSTRASVGYRDDLGASQGVREVVSPRTTIYQAAEDPTQSDLLASSTRMDFPWTAANRRCLIAVRVNDTLGAAMDLRFAGQGGFGWAGGLPILPFDSADLAVAANVTGAFDLNFHGLWVTTQRFYDGHLDIAEDEAEARWCFVEGEPEDNYQVQNWQL